MGNYLGEPEWRVDATSNFGDETFAEKTVIRHLNESQATRIAEILNERCTPSDRTYFQPRDVETKLWRGMEEFI